MKITSIVKLCVTNEQRPSLLKTIEAVNKACDLASLECFSKKVFKQYDIHKMMYSVLRKEFGLSSQIVVRAISKVADSYKKDKKTLRKFKKHGAITYDARILSWKENSVSIATLDGREKIQFVCGNKQREILKFQKGESDLIYRDGEFYLYTTCDIPEADLLVRAEFLGVDRGVNNIAADSLGNIYSGSRVISARKKYAKQRRILQKVRTKSAKRKLSKTRRKESRFAKNVNHIISKKIVETAQSHGMGIAIEDLTGIRKTTTVRNGNRYIRQSWSFYDLEQKILYKAKRVGIDVVKVDPRNTSRECSKCGHISKKNRKTQSLFLCENCGHTEHADTNASRNISRRATVNRPIVGISDAKNAEFPFPTSPSL